MSTLGTGSRLTFVEKAVTVRAMQTKNVIARALRGAPMPFGTCGSSVTCSVCDFT